MTLIEQLFAEDQAKDEHIAKLYQALGELCEELDAITTDADGQKSIDHAKALKNAKSWKLRLSLIP